MVLGGGGGDKMTGIINVVRIKKIAHPKRLPDKFNPLSLLLQSLGASTSVLGQAKEHEHQEHSVDLEGRQREGGREGGGGRGVRQLLQQQHRGHPL